VKPDPVPPAKAQLMIIPSKTSQASICFRIISIVSLIIYFPMVMLALTKLLDESYLHEIKSCLLYNCLLFPLWIYAIESGSVSMKTVLGTFTPFDVSLNIV